MLRVTVWRVLGKPSTPTTKRHIIWVIHLCLQFPHVCEVVNWNSADLRQFSPSKLTYLGGILSALLIAFNSSLIFEYIKFSEEYLF